MAQLSSRRASVELACTSLIWGFGFIAVRWSLAGMGPLWLCALRNLVAFAIQLPFLWLVPSLRAGIGRDQLRLAFAPGLALGGSLLFQSSGLRFTSATNSGFITTLYVLLVPILAWVRLGQRPHRAHGVFVTIALVGAALVCSFRPGAGVNVGDLLTLACAAFAALQIFWLSARGPRVRSPLAFNAAQSLWAGLLSLVAALALEPLPRAPLPATAWVGFAYLTVPSTIGAFALQVRAQRVLPGPVASMICLLESPFAAAFAFLLLGERLTKVNWLGAALILAATVAAVAVETGNRAPERPAA